MLVFIKYQSDQLHWFQNIHSQRPNTKKIHIDSQSPGYPNVVLFSLVAYANKAIKDIVILI
jgi:hypothetical protein